MKANEFVKKFGLDLAKRDVQAFEGGFIKREDIVEHYGFDILDDLKRLVEAHKIINLFKSLDHAKAEVKACEQSKHSEILVKLDVGVGYIWLSRVKQAIADVEICMEVS